MKLKKTILYIITLLLIPIIVTFSICLLPKKQNIKGIIIGNPIENVNLKYSYDNSFTSSFMNSSFLLQMLENDASKIRYEIPPERRIMTNAKKRALQPCQVEKYLKANNIAVAMQEASPEKA